MLGVIDIIGYIIIILLAIMTVYWESKHFVCDSLQCALYKWSRERALNDRDFYIRLIDGQTRQSVWMRSFFMATIITFIVYWWFYGGLPPLIHFIALLALIFIIIYFGLTFYQHHFLSPINTDLKGFMSTSCNSEDQRNQGEQEA